MTHAWACKCLPCGVKRSDYCRRWHRGERLYVDAKDARQLLLTFEDAKDAARALGMPPTTIWRIRAGKVKRIRKVTAERIARAA